MTACEKFRFQVQIPCTACRYCCSGCPMEINIPEYLKIYNDYKVTGAWALSYLPGVQFKGTPADCIGCGACVSHCPQSIFINAAGCCEVVSRYAVVWAAGRQSEVRNGRGAWSVRRRCCAFFSCQQFNGFGKALAEKLHDKINGCAALALAVAIPFVSPDGQAVVPFPAVFLSCADKLLAL